MNLSVAHDALQRSFGMSDVLFGYMLSAYSWTYAAMQLPSGSLLDRWGVRRVMLVAILLWALASGLAAIAPTIVLLFAARLLLGVGEAPTFPANAKAIGMWFPERERGMPTATFDAAAKLSIGIGTPVLGLILLRYGLRANFATTAVLSLLFAGVFAVVYRDPGPGEGAVEEQSAEQSARQFALVDLLRQKKVWGVALGSGAYNYCFYLLLTWMPVYLEKGVRLSAKRAVLLSGIPWLLAAVADFAVGRSAGGCADPAGVERGCGAAVGSGGWDGAGAVRGGTGVCARAAGGAGVPEPGTERTVGSGAGGVVDPVAAGAGGRDGASGFGGESGEPDRGDQRRRCLRAICWRRRRASGQRSGWRLWCCCWGLRVTCSCWGGLSACGCRPCCRRAEAVATASGAGTAWWRRCGR